jgi:hypothetical protein
MTGKKVLVPTVKPKAQVLEGLAALGVPEEDDEERVRALPPISHIKPPPMTHMSTKIRWYGGLGYEVREVANLLGVRYQQVRNVLTTEPKRAAREDVPPYVIELFEVDDDLEAMDKHALEQEMAAQRNQDRLERKRRNGGNLSEEPDDG